MQDLRKEGTDEGVDGEISSRHACRGGGRGWKLSEEGKVEVVVGHQERATINTRLFAVVS